MNGTDDVLDSHQGRSRRGTVVGVVAALLVAGGLVVARVGDDGGPSALPTATASASETETAEPPVETAEPEPTENEVEPPLPGPTRVVAPPWSGSHDSLLLASGLDLLRVRNGDSQRIGRIGSYGPALLPVTGGTVVFTSSSANYEYTSGQVSFLATGGATLARLGTAAVVAPAVDPRSVWLADKAPKSGAGITTGFVARRVDVRTGRVRQRVTLPPGHEPVAEVETGLVLRPLGRDEPDAVWSPQSKAFVRRFEGNVDAATPRTVVVTLIHCFDECTYVVDVRTGRAVYALGLDHARSRTALSPDGRRVAAYCQGQDGVLRLVVHDTLSGGSTTLARSEIHEQASTRPVWSRDSRTLYVAVEARDATQVIAWRTGANEVRTLLDETGESLVAE